jgi:hypothetical protein
MTIILKEIYELFRYSKGMSNMLMGFDSDCLEYGASHYPVMFYVLLGTVVLFYVFHYHILNSASFNKKSSCWIVGLFLALTNFVISFVWVRNIAKTADYCQEFKLSEPQDFILFGLASATISFIIWAILTSSPIPRRFAGVNMNQTTLWKP